MSPPLEPGAVIARALDIYRDHARVLIPGAAVLFAVQLVLAIALGGKLGVVVSLASLVLGTVYQGMVVELVRDVQDGRLDSSLGQLFASVTPVLVTLLAVAIIFGLGVAIGIVLLIVPGLWLMTIWAVSAPSVVVERAGVLRAFSRSRELVRGDGWSVFVVIFVVNVVLAIVGTLTALISAGLGDVGSAVITWIVTALIQPMQALTAAVLYFALRERKGEPAVPAGAV